MTQMPVLALGKLLSKPIKSVKEALFVSNEHWRGTPCCSLTNFFPKSSTLSLYPFTFFFYLLWSSWLWQVFFRNYCLYLMLNHVKADKSRTATTILLVQKNCFSVDVLGTIIEWLSFFIFYQSLTWWLGRFLQCAHLASVFLRTISFNMQVCIHWLHWFPSVESDYCWKSNSPMNSHVRLFVGRLVCHNFLKKLLTFLFLD